jgi:hypothetical protein
VTTDPFIASAELALAAEAELVRRLEQEADLAALTAATAIGPAIEAARQSIDAAVATAPARIDVAIFNALVELDRGLERASAIINALAGRLAAASIDPAAVGVEGDPPAVVGDWSPDGDDAAPDNGEGGDDAGI